MVNRIRRSNHAIGWIDYGLVGLSSSLAVFSSGMAVVKPAIAWFCVALALAGTTFSYLVRFLARRSKYLEIDGFLYTLAIISAMVGWRFLQVLLPDEGYPVELFTAAWLSWAICLGSFFTWRDNTLLFQAIPAIALFGLVGCYDTFRNVTFCFFGFLACLATLFARAHGRAMLRQAIDSGYFNRISHVGSFVDPEENNDQAFQKIKEGPWRWVAGPEWALLSAMVIILLSLLGAPIIQFSVRGVAGSVAVSLPQSVKNAASQTASAGAISSDSSGAITIGNGPNQARRIKVFEADLDEPRYLRTETFSSYTGRGWKSEWSMYYSDAPLMKTPGPSVAGASIEEIKRPKEYRFTIRPAVPMRSYPTPAEYVTSSARLAPQRIDGTVENGRMSDVSEMSGRSVEADGTIQPESCPKELPPSMRGTTFIKIPDSVADLARKAIKNAKTDFEKAKAIQTEIEGRVKYNLNAEPCPQDRDPVEFFLFDAREGYCDVFASAMTAMARTVGLPARYVIGYLATPQELAGGNTYILTEADAHAWCEIFFKDIGWVVFDPTEGAESVAGGERGASRQSFVQRPIVRTIVDVSIALMVIAAVFVAYRSIRKFTNPEDPRVLLDRAYRNFIRTLAKTSHIPRRLGVTTSEYLHVVGPLVGSAKSEADAIGLEFDNAYYSQTALTRAEIIKLSQRVNAFKQRMRALKKNK